jgi:hypothetical protein
MDAGVGSLAHRLLEGTYLPHSLFLVVVTAIAGPDGLAGGMN